MPPKSSRQEGNTDGEAAHLELKPCIVEVGTSMFSMNRDPIALSAAAAMHACARPGAATDRPASPGVGTGDAGVGAGQVRGTGDNDGGKNDTAACWCCRLGDSYFDRLVKHAVVEHERLLLQHPVQESARHFLQEGALPRQDRVSGKPSRMRSYSLTQSTLLDESNIRPRKQPAARATKQPQEMEGISSTGSPGTTRSTSENRGLAQRCSRQATAVLNEEYFEQCSRIATQLTSMNRHGTTTSSLRGQVHSFVEWLVRHPAFDSVFASLILVNSILIGYSINEAALSLSEDRNVTLHTAQFVLNVLFVLEWVLRLSASGCRTFFSCKTQDIYWNIYDTLVIVLIVLLDWGTTLAQFASPFSPSSMRAGRVLRLARVMRVVRVSRLLHVIRSFRFLVCSIASTLQSLVWAMLLLMLVFYMFASVLTAAVTEFRVAEQDAMPADVLEKAEYFWGSVPTSILTLFMSICGGVSWIEPMGTLQQVGISWCFIFLSYITFAYFAVLNVVTGVFCEKAIKSANDDHYHMLQLLNERREEFEDRLQHVFKKIDVDSSGHVTLEEFEEVMRDEEIQTFFEFMDIKVDDARDLFRYLDVDRGGVLDVTELVSGTMRIRGGAKGLDLIMLHHDVRKVKEQVRAIAGAIDELFFVEQEDSGSRTSRSARSPHSLQSTSRFSLPSLSLQEDPLSQAPKTVGS